MAESSYRRFSFTIELRSTWSRMGQCIIEVPKVLCYSSSMSLDTLPNIL